MHKPIRSSWQNLGSENGNTSSLPSSLEKLLDNIKRTVFFLHFPIEPFQRWLLPSKKSSFQPAWSYFLGSSAWKIDQFGQPGIGWVLIALSTKCCPLWQLKKRNNRWWEFTLIACYLWTIGKSMSPCREWIILTTNEPTPIWQEKTRETSQKMIGPNTPFMLSSLFIKE